MHGMLPGRVGWADGKGKGMVAAGAREAAVPTLGLPLLARCYECVCV